MSKVLLVMSLLQKAREQGLASPSIELKASRLVGLLNAVGDCSASERVFESFLRDLANAGLK
jgi:hypothetical protein